MRIAISVETDNGLDSGGPKLIHEQTTEVLLSGGTGGRAIRFFGEFGITVATGTTGTVGDALRNYLAADLREAAPCTAGVARGHGHDHQLRRQPMISSHGRKIDVRNQVVVQLEQKGKQIVLAEMTHAQEQASALYRIREGLATKVRILVPEKACPVCKQYEGVYPLDDVPAIPFPGCSCSGGCRAVYEPVLDRYGP